MPIGRTAPPSRGDRGPRALRFGALALLLLAAAAPEARATGLPEVKARGRLVVLCFPDPHSPFLSRDTSGHFDGVDVAILRSFAVGLHVPLVVHAVPRFEDLLPALVAGDGDIVAGGFSITPARERLADFTVPYFPVAIMVIARQGSGIRSVQDLAGKRGAAVPGTTHDALMREMGILPARVLDHAGLAYEALERNEADFAFVDSTSGLVSLEHFPHLLLLGMLGKADYYGFAVSKGSDLRLPLDRHLGEIRQKGLLYSFFKRYLGARAVDLYELFKKSTGGAPSRLP